MTIRPENQRLLDNLEITIRDHLLWLGERGIDDVVSTTYHLRSLIQFIIGLSAGIIAFVFPQLLLSEQAQVSKDCYLIAAILFSSVILYGTYRLFASAARETEEIPALTKLHANRALEMLQEIRNIKKLEDNNEAGKRVEKLKIMAHVSLPQKDYLFIQRIWLTYEVQILVSSFIVGYILIITGLLLN